MSNDGVISAQQCTTEIDFGADAAALLRAWHDLVLRLPHLVGDETRRRAFWDLLAWYERVFERDDFDFDPPTMGLDTLIDELASATAPQEIHAEMAWARWAIRVAEELVRWRHCLRTAGVGSPPTGPATDRLELAMEEARRHVEHDPCQGSSD